MKRISLLSSGLLLLASVPLASAAIDLCDDGIQGNRVCVERDGACVLAYYVPPFTDFFAGAAHCPLVHVGADGATACEDAWAGYWTLAGFTGFDGYACAFVYEDVNGRTCLLLAWDSNVLTPRPMRPICL